MEFRLLGKLEVEAGGVDLTPERPKQRALLAVLLLRAGEVVPTDDLVEALWRDRPPATAQTALHGHISALRKRLGAERIETRPPGYLLRLGGEDGLDVRRFEDIVAEARADGPVTRADRLREALALFRGEPLADFRYEAFASREAARLEELRLASCEELIETDLELGKHTEVIPQLERLIADNPLRERLRAQLMVALYGSDRQAEALRVFRDTRRLLASELGIEPGSALQRLERQILNHDPALAPPDLLASPSHRPAATKPAGIVTFLFASVERPTEALGEHVQTVLGRHGGFEVEAHADARLVAFARVRDAAAAAVGLQGAQRDGGLDLRIGIHSADAVSTDDGYAGIGVHGASIVCAAAHGGQILLSQTARDLLRQAVVDDVEVRDLGEHRLADLGKAQRLFELVAPGLEPECPPVRSLEARRTNLPVQATPLVGRRREIRELRDLLGRSGAGIVTLTGAGGTGKTRLALHAAAELLDDFPDGVFFVELAPLVDPDLVPATVARALGLSDSGGRTSADTLSEYLQARRLLLVLDNFEHILGAAGTVAEISATAPAVRILVTSRAPLRLAGERVYPVSPLETPAEADDLDRLLQLDSVALFASRASGVRPDFAVTAANARQVADICQALDGLPLAIELAATRVGVLPPGALLQRLEHRLKLLTRNTRDAPGRHRTLRAAIDWSFELLEPDEQRLFMRLAVFAGGCTLESAESVCGDDLDIVDGLGSLIDMNLVRSEGTDAAPRFAMLETIREYALERLEDSGEAEGLRRRHAEHFVALAEEAEPHLRERPGEWLDRLEREHDNLRAALDRLESSGGEELALRLAGALWRFWYLAGHLSEGRRRLERAVRSDGRPTAARAKALIGAAVMAVNTGDAATARLRAEEAQALHRALGDAGGAAYAGLMLAAAVSRAGDLAYARWLNEQSIRSFRELGDEHSALLAARNLAGIYARSGDAARARSLYEDNLRRARATSNARIEASSLGALAMVAVEEGGVDDARSMLKDSLRIHRELGDRLDTAVDVCRAAFVLAFEGTATTAARLLASVEALGEEIGTRRSAVAELNERTITTIRTQLDEAACAEAWRQGRALTPHDAVELALDSLD